MIEAWWRSLKHGWFYLHRLDSVAALEKLIAFYVQQHNCVMPHAAFRGQTPDEVYAGVGDRVPELLANQRRAAREARIQRNREMTCTDCSRAPPGSSEVAPPKENAA